MKTQTPFFFFLPAVLTHVVFHELIKQLLQTQNYDLVLVLGHRGDSL